MAKPDKHLPNNVKGRNITPTNIDLIFHRTLWHYRSSLGDRQTPVQLIQCIMYFGLEQKLLLMNLVVLIRLCVFQTIRMNAALQLCNGSPEEFYYKLNSLLKNVPISGTFKCSM